MRLKAINLLALSLENHLLRHLFPAAFRDTPAWRWKSRSKESHKLETRCHARRTTRERFACRANQAKVTLDDWNFDARISCLVRYRRYLGEKNSTYSHMYVYSGGIESEEEQGGETTLRTFALPPLFSTSSIRTIGMSSLRYLSLFARCIFATTRKRYLDTTRECLLALSTVHTLATLLYPGFRCSRVSTSALFVPRFCA